MASAPRSSAGGPPRDARGPAGDGLVWHSTCGYAECVEPGRYAADMTCKGCRCIKYCTFGCQKADWKRHKAACKRDEAADEAAAREGALVARPRTGPPPPDPQLLLVAALHGDVKRVEELLRLGADVNADADGYTPLYAASGGHAAVVSFDRAAVVAVLLAAPGIDVNAATEEGSTPLLLASVKGHLAIVSALLAAPGVSMNVAQEDGFTPLHGASNEGHAAVVSALLAHPSVVVNPRTSRELKFIPAGSTPLRLARDLGRLGVAALLESRGGVV